LKVLAAGQVVSTISHKIPNAEGGESRLTVELVPFGKQAMQDAPVVAHKILEWYLQTMTASDRKPTYAHFYNLMAKLGHPMKTKSKKKKVPEAPNIWGNATHEDIVKNFVAPQASGPLPKP
jgi:hypothetical protein